MEGRREMEVRLMYRTTVEKKFEGSGSIKEEEAQSNTRILQKPKEPSGGQGQKITRISIKISNLYQLWKHCVPHLRRIPHRLSWLIWS